VINLIQEGAYSEANHFLISIFEHAIAIEDILENREVRKNGVRKPHSWDSAELETWNIVQEQRKSEGKGLTIGLPRKYRLRK
jgi:hypothetical protein